MLDRITRASVASRLAIVGFTTNAIERLRDDKGQGSVEYVGIIVVVGLIILAVAGAASDVGQSIVSQLQDAIKGIGKS